MKMFYKYNLVLICLILFSTLTACREEIIPPDNPVGSVNEPLKVQSSNYYTFFINAEDISIKVSDYTTFTENKTKIFYTLKGHNSGSVTVSVYNKNQKVIYNKSLYENIDGKMFYLNPSEVPGYIKLEFYNFTGKLKVELTR